MNIILAPHIDDELIGCYSILHDIDEVYYFFDITEERKIEALNTGKKFNFKCNFNEPVDINYNDIVYVTTSMDLHRDHKYVNRLAKSIQLDLDFVLKFYSIDMNRKPKFLSDLHQQKKKDMYELYPSQKGLFDSNEKYFLFEDIFDNDFVSNSVHMLNHSDKYVKITIEDTTDWDMDFKINEWYNMSPSDLHPLIFQNILHNAPKNVAPTDIMIEIKTTEIITVNYKL